MPDDLKPCPFCGGDAEYGEVGGEGGDAGGQFVQCTNAMCAASSALIFPCGDEPKPLLALRWNRRTPNPAAFAAGAEAMREAAAEDVERWHADYAQDMAADIRALPLPTMMGGKLCEDCPPIGYPTDKTRCCDCPRKERT